MLFYCDYYKKVNADCILGTEFEDLEYLGKHFGVATVNKNNIVTSLVEKPGKTKSNLGVYATYLYKKDTVKLIKQYLEEGNSPDAPGNFPAWLHKRKPVYLYRFKGQCYDIGTIDVYNELNKKLSKKKNSSSIQD